MTESPRNTVSTSTDCGHSPKVVKGFCHPCLRATDPERFAIYAEQRRAWGKRNPELKLASERVHRSDATRCRRYHKDD